MSAADPDTSSSQNLQRDSNLIALLFEAGQQKEVASDIVVDILQEALDSGRSVDDIVDDKEILSRRQRETIRRFLTKAPQTVAGGGETKRDRQTAIGDQVEPIVSRDQFEEDRLAALPTGAARYSAVKEIGRGGWGVVLEAQDTQLDRDVAVKKLGVAAVADPEVSQRFLHEARITGQLQHPGIVPVYERGIDLDTRQPFYVMKLLKGVTLRDLIRDYHELQPGNERREAFHQLLVRFNDICQAVAYAHEKNIIHRDLKPSNVVVGEFGETIVVDWGLAKDLASPPSPLETEETVRAGTPMPRPSTRSTGALDGLLDPFVTQAGSVIGTPAFMSPEQARGENANLDCRADTYALGVILYVILTGKPPFHAEDVQTTLQKVIDGDYQHPRIRDRSIVTSLAAICTKAMSLKPADRYVTAAELSADITRYLANEPVTAHTDTAFEKLARWFRRNTGFAVSIIVCTVVLSVASTVAAVLISSAHRAENRAKEEAFVAREQEAVARQNAENAHAAALVRLDQARSAADEWLIGLSGTLQRYPGMRPVQQDLIEQATNHYQTLLTSLESDKGLALEAARCRIRLGDLSLMSGSSSDEAREFFEAAAAELQRCSDERHEVHRERLNVQLGISLCSLQDETLQAEDVVSLKAQVEEYRSRPNAELRTVARAFVVLGRAQQSLGDVHEAVRCLEEAQAVAMRTPDDDSQKHLQLLNTIREDLSQCYAAAGRHNDAASVLHDQVDVTTRFLNDHSDRPDLLESRAIARMQWAAVQRTLGREWLAEKNYREAVQDLSQSWKLMFGDYFYSENLAVAQANLGQLAIGLNRLEDAETMLRNAVDQLTGLMQSDRADRATAGRLAACNVSLGEVLLLRDHAGCGEVIQRSLDIFDFLEQQTALSQQEEVARARASANLARWYRGKSDPESARSWFEMCLKHLQDPELQNNSDAQRLLADVQFELSEFQSDADRRQQLANDAIALLTSLSENESPDMRRQRRSPALHRLRILLDSGTSFGTRLETTFGMPGMTQTSFGVDLTHLTQKLNDREPLLADPTADNFPVPPASSTDIGLYWEEVAPVTNALTMTAGARFDMVYTDAANEVSGVPIDVRDFFLTDDLHQEYYLWSAFLTGELKIDRNWTSTFGVGHGQRPPTLTEQYAMSSFIGSLQRGLTTRDGDPELNPERLTQIDIGLNGNFRTVRVGAHGYYSWIEDFITYDLIASGAGSGFGATSQSAQFTNTDLAVIAGFETYAEADLNSWVTAFGIMSYIEGRDLSRDKESRVENITNKYYREHLDYRSGRGVFRPGVNVYTGVEVTY